MRMQSMLWAGALAASVPCLAADFPERPIRIVTPFPAASVTDTIARPLANKLSEVWGQSVVVDNRGGAGGNIAAEIVAKSPPDGYTLLIGATGPNAVNASLFRKMSYDSRKAFAPITLTATNYLILTVPHTTPAKSVKELVELARAKPGQLRYASSGNGGTPHLATELFKMMTGTDMIHIPYKGSPQYMVDILAGRIDLVIASAGPVLPHAKTGRLRVLGISAPQRDPAYPDFPTIAEEGVPGFEVRGWYGLLASAGTPTPVVRKLYTEVVRILALPEVRAQYAAGGLQATVSSSPEEFAAFILAEHDKWAKVVKATGMRVD
jgi:tripartite-type tricarboxylate transporter receptor subunit TctC